MQPILVLVTLSVACIFIMYGFMKWNRVKQKTPPFVTGVNENLLANELPQDEEWWARLDTPLQLELAVSLARKALPVWQRYSEANELVYQNSSVGPLVKIRVSLLQTSLDEVAQSSILRFPENKKDIIKCYNEFVVHLIALQDGDWVVAYTVKKVFLAVYNILKGIAEQENITVMENLFSISINHSLDCLDMCKLYNREEIEVFLHSYRYQSTT